MTELLPCPFCGSDARLREDDKKFCVVCNECCCAVGEEYDRDAMPEHMFQCAEDAIAAWNRRAPTASCEELRKALEALRLHVAYEALPADRGGKNGRKGQAWTAFISARDAALAATPEPTADRGGEVSVKPLEWREEQIPPTGECLASSGVGLYCIPLGRTLFELRFRGKISLGIFDTIDAAKAAAQADYERRIRSALTPTDKG